MSANKRPLSPFMIGPYYKPQMTSILSITHRATGASLVVGTLLLVYWLAAAAIGPEAYEHAQAILGSMLGQQTGLPPARSLLAELSTRRGRQPGLVH